MSLKQKFGTDVLITTIINFSKKIRGIVFIPLITKQLGTGAYGAYSQVLVVTALFTGIFKLGLPSALVHYSQDIEDKNKQAELYYSLTFAALISGITIAIILNFASPYVSRYTLGAGSYTTVFRIGSVLVPIYVLREMSQNYFRSKRQIKRFSFYGGLKTYVLVGVVVAVLLLFELSLEGVIKTVIIVELLFVIGLQFIIYVEVGFHKPSMSNFRTYFRYSIPMMVTTFTGNLQSRVDRLLIGFYLGAESVGIYSIVYNVAQLIRSLVLPLRVTLLPELSRLIKNGNMTEGRNMITISSKYFLTIGIPSVFGIQLVSNRLLDVLATQTVVEGSEGIVFIISIGIFFWGLEIIHRQLLNASEMTSIVSKIRIVGSVLNIVLNLLLILPFGITGAAAATLASYVFTFGAVYYLTHMEFHVKFDYLQTIKTVGSALVMTIVVRSLPIQSLVGMVVVGAIVYFIALFILGGINKTEIVGLYIILKD
ncbi:lipopolysaccharide biosynthesis protein [Halorubrum ezzemoulense]|uniref:lipopolysaccharide biosynthesis protein n=1 Tax=Halorubrum ezzemoulense TaxID=337243 RepID=UPI00232D35E2|nr:oligosaccharide flippase family protein [Halorubrum ezzemoulense]MDB2243109.1 oligosaccharide flippase family protein [Halorubrum ezzemoulense]